MTEELLSQYYPKFTAQAHELSDILKNGIEQNIIGKFQNDKESINISEFSLRHNSEKKDNEQIIDKVKKKLKLNDKNQDLKIIKTIREIKIQTDLKYNPKYFQENDYWLNKNLDALKKNIMENQTAQEVIKTKNKIKMQRALNIWFQESQQQKNEQQNRAAQTTNKKNLLPSSQLIIKQHQTEGIQVSGVITTKQGYKMTYPNLNYIIKASDIPDLENKTLFIKKIKPLSQFDNDYMDDLRRYVWKQKQYIQFFKVLLKVSQGNLEISETLVKVQQKMKTGFYHVMTFYHISNRSWAICKLIKDLNKRNFFVRERQNLYDTMLSNIQEDLNEIFEPLLETNDLVPIEEQFISFDQYKKRLSEVILIREN